MNKQPPADLLARTLEHEAEQQTEKLETEPTAPPSRIKQRLEQDAVKRHLKQLERLGYVPSVDANGKHVLVPKRGYVTKGGGRR